MSKRSDCSSQLGGAALLSCVAVLLVTALPLTAAAQSCVPTRDPVLIAATQAQRAGHIDEARKIVWDGRQAIEQSAPDSPKLALYLRRTAGMNGADAVADLQRAMEIDTKAFGPNSCAVAGDLYALAFVHQETQPAETERILKQVIDLLDDSPEKLGLKSTRPIGQPLRQGEAAGGGDYGVRASGAGLRSVKVCSGSVRRLSRTAPTPLSRCRQNRRRGQVTVSQPGFS